MTTDNVAHLRTHTAPVTPADPDVVELLERLLAAAKAGEFNGIAVTTVELVGAGQAIGIGTAYAGQGIEQAVHTALGAVETLKQRLGKSLIESW